MMKKLDTYVLIASYTFLIFPVLLFAVGWLNFPLMVVMTGLLLFGGFKAVKDFHNDQPFKISLRKIIIALAIIFVIMAWVYLSGIGGFMFQNDDFELRNVMLHDLIDLHWPVQYSYPTEPKVDDMAGHQGALVYYFTYWLPAALIGKLAGWKGANIFLYFWTVLGVLLSFYWFARNVKKWPLMLLFLFIFWSGMDAAGQFSQGNFSFAFGDHIEWWLSDFQYSSNTTTLFWVFNQTVVPWLIVMLMINRINKKSLLFTYALCLPYAPFSFIGLTPFVAYYLFSNRMQTDATPKSSGILVKPFLHWIWSNIKAAFSFANLLAAPLIIGVFLIFFSSTGGRFNGEFIWPYHFGPGANTLPFLMTYLLFCLLEFGIFALIIMGKFRKEPVFLIAITLLLLIPSYQMGINNDFVMRASIPSLIFLMIFTAKFLAEPIQGRIKTGVLKFLIIVFLLIGAVTPFNEIYRSVDQTIHNPQGMIKDNMHTLSKLDESRSGSIESFVVKDPRNSLFFQYLGGDLKTGNLDYFENHFMTAKHKNP
jgi:hypothetical protein